MSDVNTDERLRAVEQHLSTHEAVCAERYNGIIGTAGMLSAQGVLEIDGYVP